MDVADAKTLSAMRRKAAAIVAAKKPHERKIKMESIKKRNPYLAGLLSLITPGLGQIYNGDIKKGTIFFICGLIMNAIIFMGIFNIFYGLIFFILIIFGFYLWVIIDSIVNAKKLKEYQMKSFNKWYVYLMVIIIMSVLNNLCSPLIPVKSYVMAGVSMFPTIKESERIVVNKFYYQKHKPSRGDVLIFTPPDDLNKSYIKRVLALGGEKLEIKGSKIFINGIEIEKKWTSFLENENEPKLQESNIYEIPQDTVFVLGDNFEHSRDSRDLGPIKLQSIKGKVLYIYWSENWKKIGQSF